MSDPEFEPTVVLCDPHARKHLIQTVYENYGPNVNYVIGGDIFDGEDTAATIAYARKIDAVLVWGNHEWSTMGSMLSASDQESYAWSQMYTRLTADRLLESYGISGGVTPGRMQQLREKMIRRGDLAYLKKGRTFYEGKYLKHESQIGDFVVTHTGVTGLVWVLQKVHLKEWQSRAARGDFGRAGEGPDQVMGFKVIGEAEVIRKNQRNKNEPKVVRGHFHRPVDEERVLAGGMLVNLATDKSVDDSVYVYENWSDNAIRLDVAA